MRELLQANCVNHSKSTPSEACPMLRKGRFCTPRAKSWSSVDASALLSNHGYSLAAEVLNCPSALFPASLVTGYGKSCRWSRSTSCLVKGLPPMERITVGLTDSAPYFHLVNSDRKVVRKGGSIGLVQSRLPWAHLRVFSRIGRVLQQAVATRMHHLKVNQGVVDVELGPNPQLLQFPHRQIVDAP